MEGLIDFNGMVDLAGVDHTIAQSARHAGVDLCNDDLCHIHSRTRHMVFDSQCWFHASRQ